MNEFEQPEEEDPGDEEEAAAAHSLVSLMQPLLHPQVEYHVEEELREEVHPVHEQDQASRSD